MSHRLAHDLELHKVLSLVAAHARSGMGRLFVLRGFEMPTRSEAEELARFTLEAQELVETAGTISLAGFDDAWPLLTAEGPISSEPSDLLSIITCARRVAAARRRLLGADEALHRLRALGRELPDTEELVRWAGPRLGRDGRVPDDASPELARLRHRLVRQRQELVADLEAIRRSHGEVVTDAPPTLRHQRYCIPVRASARTQLPGLVLDSSGSGATAFLEPYPVVEQNNALIEATAREREEVRRILEEVSAAVTEVREDLVDGVEVLARLDAAQARVLFGRLVEGRVIIPGGGNELAIRGARHPLLDQRLAGLRLEVLSEDLPREVEREAVPLDFSLPEHVCALVVSGPNAGGKTVVLKTLGLMVLMAYRGIPLPVDEGTTIPFFDQIWCHIGDEQDVSADLSTFSGAMTATARLLDSAGPDALVLYDELGAGTDPLEGAALGCALLEELTRRGCLTVATTHLAAISLSAASVQGMATAAMNFDEQHERSTYQLRLGRPGRSHGLEIARAVGVAPAVLDRARDLLGGQHLELDRWLSRLEKLEAELVEERAELGRHQIELQARELDLRSDEEALSEEKAMVPQTLAAERDRLRLRAKSRLDHALEELAKATRDLRPLGKRRQQQLRREAVDLPLPEEQGPAVGAREITVGDGVRITGLGASGVVQELRGQRARVAVGSKRLWVARDELRLEAGAEKPARVARVQVDATDSVPPELLLLGKDSEDARREVERYLDQAFAAGCSRVRVVHGHGTGTLRRVVTEVLGGHPAVRSFSHPPRNRGGTGATEVILEES